MVKGGGKRRAKMEKGKRLKLEVSIKGGKKGKS